MIKLSKKAVILTLALIAVIATAGTAFAYWSSGFNNTNVDKTATIQIGSGGTVDTALSLDDMLKGEDEALIPAGRSPENGQVNSVAYTCDVLWSSTDANSTLAAAGVTGTLSVALTGITIGSTTYTAENDTETGILSLFSVSIKAGEAAPSTSFTITGELSLPLTFTFTMGEPTSKAQYELVQGADVVFNFTFAVVVGSGT